MPIDPTPEGGEILHQPVVKPFPESTPNNEEQDKHQEEPETTKKGRLEGETSAEDENQPGFIGERNLPHS